MTLISLKLLAHFLNKYTLKGRIADYGGTDTIGGKIINQMLGLDNVSITEGKPGSDTNVLVNGNPAKRIGEYFPLDYDNGVDLMKPITGKKFDGGICMDLLEHVADPFAVAKNITNSLNKGAILFVTVPWVWELHYFPKDYWRFTPQGLEQLFSKMKAITVEVIRDPSPDETLPRHRLVAIFRKK